MESYKRYLLDELDMSEADADLFLTGFYTVNCKKGEYLLKEGGNSSIIRIILKGCARGYAIVDGKEVTTNFYFENDHAYDYINYLHRQPSGMIIQALDTVEAIEMNLGISDFLTIENPGILQMGLNIFGMNMLRIEQERRNFILKSPKERYLDLLSNNKQVISRVPQHQIATYIGISAEHLSRIRKEILKS